MDAIGVALWVMIAGYMVGACLALMAPSPRAARVITGIGAGVGSVGGLAAALTVLATGRPF